MKMDNFDCLSAQISGNRLRKLHIDPEGMFPKTKSMDPQVIQQQLHDVFPAALVLLHI